MSNGFWDTAAVAALNWLIRAIPPPDWTPVKVSLHTAEPGDTGANEVAGGSYARVAVAAADWVSAAPVGGGSATWNAYDISFADMPETVVTHLGLWSSDGTVFIMSAPIDSGGTPVSGGATFTILAGKLRPRLNRAS